MSSSESAHEAATVPWEQYTAVPTLQTSQQMNLFIFFQRQQHYQPSPPVYHSDTRKLHGPCACSVETLTLFLDMWLIASYSFGKQEEPVIQSIISVSAYTYLCSCCVITWMVFGTLRSCCPLLTLLNIWTHCSFADCAFSQICLMTFFFLN